MFSKNIRYLLSNKIRYRGTWFNSVNKSQITSNENELYKQALVVAQYQFLIRCYSAMFRHEI